MYFIVNVQLKFWMEFKRHTPWAMCRLARAHWWSWWTSCIYHVSIMRIELDYFWSFRLDIFILPLTSFLFMWTPSKKGAAYHLWFKSTSSRAPLFWAPLMSALLKSEQSMSANHFKIEECRLSATHFWGWVKLKSALFEKASEFIEF